MRLPINPTINSDPRATQRHRDIYAHLWCHANLYADGSRQVEMRYDELAPVIGLTTRGSSITKIILDLEAWRYLVRLTDGRGRHERGTRWRIVDDPAELFCEMADRIINAQDLMVTQEARAEEVAILRVYHAADLAAKDAKIAALQDRLNESLICLSSYIGDLENVQRMIGQTIQRARARKGEVQG